MAQKPKRKSDSSPCQWISGADAFKEFATHKGKTQSARHIKPLHWYIACRLVIEGGFEPDDITPRPPFRIETKNAKGKRVRHLLHFDPALGGSGEQIVLGGLKTKNVDVVVNRYPVGPVLAVSCKGVTKAFRNLTNRMEETIGECTNLHITYPAMVVGYFAVLRANRTIKQAIEAADLDPEDSATEAEPTETEPQIQDVSEKAKAAMAANDIAVLEDGTIVDGIVRFHAALREMTSRRGIRDEISRYEAMTMALIEPGEDIEGDVFSGFPPSDSPLQLGLFFQTLYQRYEERFVYGAPLLAERGLTTRLEWDPESPIFDKSADGPTLPEIEYAPRMASPDGMPVE